MHQFKVLAILLAILLGLSLCCSMCKRREGFNSHKDDEGTYSSAAGSKATITSNVDGSQKMTILVPKVDKPITYNRDITSGDFFDINKTPAFMFTDGLGRRTIKIVYNNKTVTLIKDEPFKPKFDTTTPVTPVAVAPVAVAPVAVAPVALAPVAPVAAAPVAPVAPLLSSPPPPKSDYSTAIPPNLYNNPPPGSIPAGIPHSRIPKGQEHLYILKSQVVPPVCPACPSAAICATKGKPPPPCPACARCPEPSITCKAVPNYSAIANEYLPTPVLADFSKF
jgi:hypothetical protein